MSYAQSGEDEMILALAAKMPGIPRTFVDIGAGDGERWSNTRLLLDQGWEGDWYDVDEGAIAKARDVNPRSWCVRVDLVSLAQLSNRGDGLGVLSIDVDGNDYHLWKRSYELGWRPWIVCIESQIQPSELHPDSWSNKYVMPYDPEYVWDHQSYDCGATPAALIALGVELGYQYVGKPEDKHSPNLLFVRSDIRQVVTRPANLVDH